jgi:predicted GNAT family acetyltransferase
MPLIHNSSTASVTDEYRVRRFQRAGAFLDCAGAWLLAAEAENNLILGIAATLRNESAYQTTPYLAVVEQADAVVGCVLRTPPHKPILSNMPLASLPCVVSDLHAAYHTIPAVLGPNPPALRFAELWSATTGVHWQEGRQSRIYQLVQVVPPVRMAPGSMRAAGFADIDRVAAWIQAFSEEVDMPTARAHAMADERVRRNELFLWIDGDVRSMAAWAGRTPNSIRIGYVYTPPEQRGRGYASALTAAVSQRALDSGCRYCFLFADLANPTSNQIYQAIGYEPVCDVIDYVFAESE